MNTSYFRIGQGFDIHRYVDGPALILGGMTIPHHQGLLGDSDGDCLTHAIIDALLGAVHWGNIGEYFPAHTQHSYDVLCMLFQELYRQGTRLHNLDSTIIAEAPRLTPYIPSIGAHLAEALRIPPTAISIKPKTHDQLDDVGQGAGIAVHVVLLLTIPTPTLSRTI